jgi:hypothetical protein
LVYEHTKTMPEHQDVIGETRTPVRMGNYSRSRLPESVLADVWSDIVRLGFRAPVSARLSPGARAAHGVTYTVTVENWGLQGKGLTAEELSVALTLPAAASIVETRGAGYQGTRRTADATGEHAVWQIPRLGPKEHQTYTITLSGTGAGTTPRGTVSWPRPAQWDGSGDTVNVTVPPTPTPAP